MGGMGKGGKGRKGKISKKNKGKENCKRKQKIKIFKECKTKNELIFRSLITLMTTMKEMFQ